MSLTVSELYSIRDRNAQIIYELEDDIIVFKICLRSNADYELKESYRRGMRRAKSKLEKLVIAQKRVKKAIAENIHKYKPDPYRAFFEDNQTIELESPDV